MITSEKNGAGPQPTSSTARLVRETTPRVHCIVNEAAMNFTANALLAIGAEPSMTNDSWEVQPFVESSNALSVNLGMLNDAKRRAIRVSVKTANNFNIPWVLDPTLIDRSDPRLSFARQLLHYHPSVVRGNSDEIASLCKAMDATVEMISEERESIFVTSGNRDHVTSVERTTVVNSGHAWMHTVTGMGCALSAVISAFISCNEDSFNAVIDALKLFGNAGTEAGHQSAGPGTFETSFLDQLYHLSFENYPQ